jgi:hypothetical protein
VSAIRFRGTRHLSAYGPGLERRPAFESSQRAHVSNHKVEQRRLHHRGREFHFVSYEAQVANERRGVQAIPPMWYLMNEGKRRPVLPHVPGQELPELDNALLQWVDEQVFGIVPVVAPRRR